MAFTENGLSAADVAAVTGEGRGSYGWGDGSFWIIVLFLFALMGNGWNGNGNTGTNADVQRGFDQQSVMSGINGLTATVSNGFANAEVSRCNTQANLMTQLNTIAMNQQNCCCDTRESIADLKYTIATENCSDRAALNDGVRDIIAANNASTQAILDKLCQQEIDNLKAENANLQTQINLANLQSSQANQTAKILADNAAQTVALEQYLNPTPIPAYMVQNPNCCTTTPYNGCGCNG